MRIGLFQQVCEKGAIRQNLEGVLASLNEASARGIDIAAFPEMNLTGYADPTRYPEAVIELDGPELAEFLRRGASFPGLVLAGLIERNPLGKPFITSVAVRGGRLLGVYRKLTIRDEEALWFTPGERVPVFEHAGVRLGISICADIDNPEVFAACRHQGARLVFELAAPGLYGEQEGRDWQSGYAWWEGKCREQLGGYARQHGLWIAAATQAGRTLDEDFPGGGFLFAPDGRRLYATADGSPGAVFLEIDLDAKTVKDLSSVDETHSA